MVGSMSCTSYSACLAVKLGQVLGRPHAVRRCSEVLHSTRCNVTMSAAHKAQPQRAGPGCNPMACSRLISSHARATCEGHMRGKLGEMHQACLCTQLSGATRQSTRQAALTHAQPN